MMLAALQVFVSGLYLPPVFTSLPSLSPPQTIISLPVHTAVCASRSEGALEVLVGAQLSVLGLYRLPLFKKLTPLNPPQMIISLPVHTAVKNCRQRRRVDDARGCPCIGA